MNTKSLLRFSIEMGADEAIGESPRNYFALPPMVVQVPVEMPAEPANPQTVKLQASPALAANNARQLADAATTLAELEEAVRNFDGCMLKKTASKTVFADGNPQGGVMIIGEAPGADEDRQGIPFCGVSGQLLDKMFAAIGMNRAEHIYISNTVFWRPPGNRQPSIEETAICLPFVEKHIALVKPKLLVLAGGTAVGSLLGRTESISRLRGKRYPYTNPYMEAPIDAMATYHPSYLLRQPAQKKLAWQDLIVIKAFIG